MTTYLAQERWYGGRWRTRARFDDDQTHAEQFHAALDAAHAARIERGIVEVRLHTLPDNKVRGWLS